MNQQIATPQELFSILRQYNPWWSKIAFTLPVQRRAAFSEIRQWVMNPPAKRATLLSGARQVGKTTLLLQLAEDLIQQGVKPENILYATFDHPLLKLIGIEQTLKIWRDIFPPTDETEYLLLDEIQYTSNWQTWVKHQVDFFKHRRIIVTGSAIPLDTAESGVGRWHTIKLPTLSFYEYLQIKGVKTCNISQVYSLHEVFNWTEAERVQTAEAAKILVPHFHQYLLKGGFPQTALMDDISMAQKLTREDIVDKVLKRDMTAVFGVRRVLELERLFLYLCLHDGGILDIAKICENLEMNKITVSNFIDLLEAAHLIYRLRPYGFGKELLRGKAKVYLADAAIAGSVLLKGESLLEDPTRLGAAVETAVFKHLFTRYYQTNPVFYYWKGKRDLEVDIIGTMANDVIPFEVKYRQKKVLPEDVKGLLEFYEAKNITRGYIITRNEEDFSLLKTSSPTSIMKIPAALACYWLSQSEYSAHTVSSSSVHYVFDGA
jgi:predicted AAA+ superfamily ATPase